MDEQSDPRFLVGQVLAERYWLQEHLGRGAMGDVFRARHAKVPRAFAVKVLHPELVADPKTCLRFEREAELAGRLHHRNVVSVIDVGETPRSRFLVMEFAEGVSLVDVIAGQPMSSARVINLAKQICDGLQHAHEHELVHRDLKPENIIVERTGDDEVPRIVDFGLAILRDGRTAEDVERLTTRGIVLGTPHYLAPETALGAEIDHRIDLFALGVIMFEMLTGVMPYDGDGVDVARANLHLATPAMADRVPGIVVDPLLEALVVRLLEKNPDDRPQTAREVRSLLDMIEKDRKHAAFVLGTVEPTESVVAPVLAPISEPEEPWFDAPPSEREISTDRLSQRALHATDEVSAASRPRRRAAVAAICAVSLLALILFVGLRSRERPALSAPPPVAMRVVAREPVPAPMPVVDQPAPHVVEVAPAPKVIAPARPKAIAAHSVMAALPPTKVEAAPPPPADVIEMYQRLGRRLKSIADRRDMTADDLWVRYRRVRIQDVYSSSTKRADAVSILSTIDADLKSRFPAPL